MVKIIYQVRGWDGDTVCYISRERALEELERRRDLADKASLIEKVENEIEIYVTYSGSFHFFGDDKLYLTLETVPLYE